MQEEVKIFRFKKELNNMNLKSRFEGKDENGNIVMLKLVEGENTLVEKDQHNPNAKEKNFKVSGNWVKEGDEYYVQMAIKDKMTIEMLRKRADYGRNIFEFDPIAEAKREMEETNKSLKLIMKVSSFDETETLQLAYVLFGREAFAELKNTGNDGLKLKVLAYTDQYPNKVNDILEEGNQSDYLFAGLAMAKDIIKEDVAGTEIQWSSNDVVVTRVPKGVKPIDALVEFFATSEGKEVKQEIGLKLKADVVEAKTKAKTTTAKK